MGLTVNPKCIDADAAEALVKLCPFGAITHAGVQGIEIGAGCRMCKLCVTRGPQGAVEFREPAATLAYNRAEYCGVAVLAQTEKNGLHPVSLELLGEAQRLALVTGEPVNALLIGSGVQAQAHELLRYGARQVCVYDYPEFSEFLEDSWTNAFADFVEKLRPGSVLVGATALGRSLAPRVAARFKTGLTADCTQLQMRENSDLVQIRPAFGGNIMAQIVTPKHRPQFCTVRYKIFSAPVRTPEAGTITAMELAPEQRKSALRILSVERQLCERDISEAEVLVAVGRGVRKPASMKLAAALAEAIGAQLACTRPLVECGWFDAKKQIGLSGRTVKPKLLIALGISGSVQFAAGMCGADRIIAINSDPKAPIFNVAHEGFVGDISELLQLLLAQICGEEE